MKELLAKIGTQGLLRVDELYLPVIIDDVKIAYGNERFLVKPVGGKGEQWVDKSRVRFTA